MLRVAKVDIVLPVEQPNEGSPPFKRELLRAGGLVGVKTMAFFSIVEKYGECGNFCISPCNALRFSG